jgi:hypothetical protein
MRRAGGATFAPVAGATSFEPWLRFTKQFAYASTTRALWTFLPPCHTSIGAPRFDGSYGAIPTSTSVDRRTR